MIRLVAIDMDETLLRADKTFDTERFIRVVKELSNQGVVICIASGNMISRLEAYLPHEVRDTLYLAGENGNLTEKAGVELDVCGLTDADVLTIAKASSQRSWDHLVLSTGERVFSTNPEALVSDYVNIFYPDLEYTPSYEAVLAEFTPIKIAIHSADTLAHNKIFAREVAAKLPEVVGLTSGPEWIDFYPKAGGKDRALRFLQDKYHIKPAETIAFGDSLNDLPMMAYAKYSVAMANADTDLKAHCVYEIGSNEEQAVITVLEDYLKTGQLDFLPERKG